MVHKIPTLVQYSKILAHCKYNSFANPTRFLSEPCNDGKPFGHLSDRSGFGSGPSRRRISLARLQVPHGGPMWTAMQFSWPRMRHASSLPYSVVTSIRKTGHLVCFETCASTPILFDSPRRRTSAQRPPVPLKSSTNMRSSNFFPATLFPTRPVKSTSVDSDTCLQGPSALANLLFS